MAWYISDPFLASRIISRTWFFQVDEILHLYGLYSQKHVIPEMFVNDNACMVNQHNQKFIIFQIILVLLYYFPIFIIKILQVNNIWIIKKIFSEMKEIISLTSKRPYSQRRWRQKIIIQYYYSIIWLKLRNTEKVVKGKKKEVIDII